MVSVIIIHEIVFRFLLIPGTEKYNKQYKMRNWRQFLKCALKKKPNPWSNHYDNIIITSLKGYALQIILLLS